MSIELQKIPGDFNPFPAAWPKMHFSNLNQMAMDWWADDLDLGTLNKNWVDRIEGVSLAPFAGTGFQPPQVVAGASGGHQALKFDGISRLTSIERPFKRDFAISIVYKMAANSVSYERLISGRPGFRSLAAGTMSTNPSLIGNVATGPSAYLNTRTVTGVKFATWQTVVMSHAFAGNFAMKMLGGAMTSEATVATEIDHQEMMVGYNNAGTISEGGTAGLHGEIARISIWDIGLNEVEIDAMNKRNQKAFALK